MRVTLNRTHGAQYEGRNEDGRTVTLSGSPEIGPSEAGVRPMQAVLFGLAGCSAVDVQLILQKGRYRVDDLEVIVDAERADAIPAVFTEIHMHFEASGDFPRKKLERAVRLSHEKYCSVARMLEPGVRITTSCALREEPPEG
ncbi:MAG: OsmC family protein [Myxococcota bacterium]